MLPESVEMKEVMHGSGAKGMAFYGYEDVSGLGVEMDARRETSRHAFVETWFHAMLPGMRFKSYAEMRTEHAKLTPEQIEAEKAMYPYIRRLEKDSCGNACRLCPRQPYVPGPRVLHDTLRVDLATGWRGMNGWTASLCHAHADQFKDDPKALLAALEAEVEQRRQRAAARGIKW